MTLSRATNVAFWGGVVVRHTPHTPPRLLSFGENLVVRLTPREMANFGLETVFSSSSYVHIKRTKKRKVQKKDRRKEDQKKKDDDDRSGTPKRM